MVLTRISGAGLVAVLLTSPVYAECKPTAANYEILDIGELVQGQIEARSIHIDSKGQSVVRVVTDESEAEFTVNRKGKSTSISYTEDGAERRTLALLDNRMKLVDYVKKKPGYLNLKLTTLVGRRGNEVDVKDYCKPHIEGWELDTFKISQSGDKMAALFKGTEGHAIVACREGSDGELLFSSTEDMTLEGINNEGALTGLKTTDSGAKVWRFSDANLDLFELPEDVLDVEIQSMTDGGSILISTIGAVTNSAFYYDEMGKLNKMNVLPGEGWDVDWIVQGPCGHAFGQATFTNFATFISLSEEEKAKLQENMLEFMSYAAEREDALFFWSPDTGGDFLKSVARSIRDWQYLEINAVNAQGQAVGEATDKNGVVRAIRFDPVN